MIVIDTHVLIWWASGDEIQFTEKAKEALAIAFNDGSVFVSSASVWEVAILTQKRRVGLTSDISEWLREIEQIKALTFVPVDNDIAVRSTMLGENFHKDPADRFIVATSLKLGLPLMTADRKIRDYKHVQTIW